MVKKKIKITNDVIVIDKELKKSTKKIKKNNKEFKLLDK